MPTQTNSETTPTTEYQEPIKNSLPMGRIPQPLPIHSQTASEKHVNNKISAAIEGKKLWEFHFKKGPVVTKVIFEAESFESADELSKKMANKFGVRYVTVRPHVYDLNALMELTDLPRYI